MSLRKVADELVAARQSAAGPGMAGLGMAWFF